MLKRTRRTFACFHPLSTGSRVESPNRWSRCACGRGRGFGRMVLLTDRGPSGYLRDVWASLKASAAANPDVPTVLILVALDVDALAACAILMVRGLGPRTVPAAAHMRPTERCPATGSPPHPP